MSNDPDDELSVVPLLMQNKPPIGDDSADDKMADLELRPEEVSKREGLHIVSWVYCIVQGPLKEAKGYFAPSVMPQ